jgi:hypothetical protein
MAGTGNSILTTLSKAWAEGLGWKAALGALASALVVGTLAMLQQLPAWMAALGAVWAFITCIYIIRWPVLREVLRLCRRPDYRIWSKEIEAHLRHAARLLADIQPQKLPLPDIAEEWVTPLAMAVEQGLLTNMSPKDPLTPETRLSLDEVRVFAREQLAKPTPLCPIIAPSPIAQATPQYLLPPQADQ